MARSSSIWLVYDPSGKVAAAFTVKHEMLSWIRSQPDPITTWTVHRMPDNPSKQHHRMPDPIDLAAMLVATEDPQPRRSAASTGCSCC
jgi:hypothetical protein